ncbi:TauD/TfdA family dioxygenase [Serpentinimonas maccroryi]|uniref:TauD/TfdA family dioxygenase n=1 Tax=Serpentinimonas maccroryi TaxID=1458426 RepID=UPI0020331DD2|nr:TauD/TfdA family dioxygenase [Serpentinimonas maccroryi]MCM2477928.1 TauD/TfdA family dioxygenase [Serpentinimonas maccroryi]
MSGTAPNPFDLDQPQAYAQWRAARLATMPQRPEDLIVDVADPRCLSADERAALLRTCARANMVVYRSPVTCEDKALPRLLGAQLGLHRLDANWLADEDGISPIAVSAQQPGARADFIPYTDKPIRWHTDGYYHPQSRRIEGMLLHCVRAARVGGVSGLVDHHRLYIALRDANPAWVRALMAPDAMTIPERADDHGVARPAQSGPVFSVLPGRDADHVLHMRYTARTRSIAWKDDTDTRAAVAFLEQLLSSDAPWIFRLLLQPGMGLVCNNVPHERSAFTDDPLCPRMLYRARYLDRVAAPPTGAQRAPLLAVPEWQS